MLLSIKSKENQNKRTLVNSNKNIIRNCPIPILPISFSILFFILIFINTPVYCQKKEQAKPTSKNAIEQQKSFVKKHQVKTNETTDISLALEFELMDDIVSESELFERIQKSADAKMPIQIKRKAESVYWIFTDTNTSTAYTKEIFSAAGLKVNFISKSYRLK